MRWTILVIISVMGALFTSLGIDVSQTDWSGGWAVPGPVSDWGTSFLTNDRSDFSSTGVLSLSQMPEYFEIYSNNSSIQILADMDQDGDTDFVTGFTGIGLCWLENESDGTDWIMHVIHENSNGYYISCIGTADIDDDNFIDIVMSWDNPGAEIVWLKNPGNDNPSIWQTHIIDPNGEPARFETVDVDLDGDPDVIGIASKAGGWDTVVWWENFSQGTYWSKYEIDDEQYFNGKVVAADLTGNSYIDLACYRFVGEPAQWELIRYRQDGQNWYESTISSIGKSNCLTAGNINSDGDLDLVAYEGIYGEDNELVWYELVSGNTWERHVIYVQEAAGIVGWNIGVSDLDGDGDDDVFALSLGNTTAGIRWWENNGTGLLWNSHYLAWGFSGGSIGSADINLDGNLDLVTNLRFPPAWKGIKWWDLSAENGYYDDGKLVSSVLDTGTEPAWQYIDWYETGTSLTSVEFQVRGGSDPDDLGEWSGNITSPQTSLAAYLSATDRYIQYKALLSTQDSDDTPLLHDVTFHYWPLGIEGEQIPEIAGYSLSISGPNPAFTGTVSMNFSIPYSGHVRLDVYDLSGRVIQSLSDEDFTTGEYSCQTTDLSPGVYLCRMQASGFTDSVRFVVLD